MIYIAQITHDLKNNTLEVLWLEETPDTINRIKNRNYSPAQKADFVADIADPTISDKYVLMAGW